MPLLNNFLLLSSSHTLTSPHTQTSGEHKICITPVISVGIFGSEITMVFLLFFASTIVTTNSPK